MSIYLYMYLYMKEAETVMNRDETKGSMIFLL